MTRPVAARGFSLALIAACAAGSARAQELAPAPATPLETPVKTPEVSDPMLAPAPAAPREIGSWEVALRMVREKAPQYLSSYQRVLQAEAQSQIAVGSALPMLNGTASYTHQFFTERTAAGVGPIEGNEVPPNDVFGAGVQLRAPIVDLRAFRGLGTAERNVDAARLSFDEQRRQIAIGVVQTLMATLAAARVAELNRLGLRYALERLALAKARLEYGQGTALDLDRAQEDVAFAREQLLEGDETLRQTREALGLTLGEPGELGASNRLDLAGFEREVARTCRLQQSIEQRSDVAAARARLEVQERLITDAELQYAPTLDLVSQLQYATKVTFGPKVTWSLQGVLNVPIYDGTRQGIIEQSEALAEQARQDLVATRQAALVQFARAQRAVQVAEAERAVARERRDLARRIDERIRKGYAGGIGTSLDLVLTAQSLRLAENNLALLEFQVVQARANAVLANAECSY